MKDESKGKIISEFVGLKSKMYSLVDVNVKKMKKQKKSLKLLLRTWDREFVDALFNKKLIRHSMKTIKSKLHITETYNVGNISLSCFDGKRYILGDGINSLAYFHKDTRSQ